MIDYAELLQRNDLITAVEKTGVHLHRAGSEWRGACPIHGGSNTNNFSIYRDGGKLKWKCFSNDCGQGDVVDFTQKYYRVERNRAVEMLSGINADPALILQAAAERSKQAERELEEKIQQAQAVLAEMRRANTWQRYNDALQESEYAKDLWRARGIPDEWQGIWRLGYCDSFPVRTPAGEWKTSTLTIPIWGPEWELENIRHRLNNPYSPTDKYRPERAGLPAIPYMGDPDLGWNADRVLVVEGEIKAMVVYLTLDTPGVQVIGIPGKLAFRNSIEKLRGHDVVISLDPGAEAEAAELARLINGRTFYLPEKIDDAIQAGDLNKRSIRSFIETARRVK